jgi:tetratricopeptide (TPR) repeat protein
MMLSAKWKIVWLLIASLLLCSCRESKVQQGMRAVIEHSDGDSTEEETDPQQLMMNVLEGINTRDYGSALENLEILKTANYDRIWAGMSEASIDQRLGNYDRAFRIIDALHPDYYMSEALQIRADTLQAMHRLDEARRDYEQLTNIFSDQTSSNILYSRWLIAYEQGDLEGMRDLATELDSRPKTDVFDLYWIYIRAQLDGDIVAAEQALDRITNLPSTTEIHISSFWDPYLIIWRAGLMYEQGDVDRAIETMEDMSEQYPYITDQWPEIVSDAVNIARYDYAYNAAVRGIMHAGGEQILRGMNVDIPDEIATLDIPDGPPRSDHIAYLLSMMGTIRLANGDVEDAIEYARAAERVNPYLDTSYGLESNALEINGDAAGAIEATINGLDVEPLSTSLCLRYITLASRFPSLIDSDDPDPAAIADGLLERTANWTDLYPHYPGIAYYRGQALKATGGDGWLDYYETAWRSSRVEWLYKLVYAAGLAEVGRLDEAYDVMHGVEIPTDLSWLFYLNRRADETGSEELAEFYGWIREKMDPDNHFADFLD